ncbi:MAG: beta-ketoacyl-[acyl-carrier-protein] synthase family protein, partial [Myxococcota bacterium]
IAAALHLEGPTTANFSACAASLQAIGRAFRDIQAGRVRRALAGGMDAMTHPFGMISFMRLGALSTRNDAPQQASRPFDKDRDGFVLGEGGAMVLLESLEAARARGATVLAEVVGYGTSIDAHMVTAPHPEGKGAQLAMARALRDAQLDKGAVDYINAHGTATSLNDSTESKAIRSLWGAVEPPPVSSTKSMTGHLIAAAGVLEMVACVVALRDGVLPPSINITAQDPACDVPVVNADKGVEADVRIAMTNSFGFGGQNGVLIVKRWDED